MKPDQQEDLTPYRTYFGLTMLQFLGSLMVIGLVLELVLKFFF